ncbi:MAG: Rnf-Nqr domain containing protein [Dethiobacteria bacterium]|nr:Rnf-Nqr domain containing protein [Bacillota bacterium]
MASRWYRLYYTKPFVLIKDGIWRKNSVASSTLGICSALAVTNRLENGIAMGLAVMFVVMVASLSTAVIREYIPLRLRMITYMIIISTFVISVDMFFKGFFPDISRALGPYVPLIITNCIIMGRCEAFALKNPVGFSLTDAFAHGLGYTFILLILSAVREVLAFGTLLNINVTGEAWTNWMVMAMAPGGFFLLAVIVWIVRSLQGEVEEAGATPAEETVVEVA